MKFTHLYRIYTEWSDAYQAKAETIMSTRYESFNIVHGTGHWKNQREVSMTIELMGSDRDGPIVRELAQMIRFCNNQEAIFMSTTKIDAEIIY